MRLKIKTDYIFIAALVILTIAWCAFNPPSKPKQTYPEPATYEDIAEACPLVCCGYGENQRLLGSCVLVGSYAPNKQLRVYLITASHVVAELMKEGRLREIPLFIHRRKENDDYRVVFKSTNNANWFRPNGRSDIAVIDITDEFFSNVALGIGMKCVLFATGPYPDPPKCVVKGTFIAPSRDFGRYKIGVGSDVLALGLSMDLANSMAKQDSLRQPLEGRAGVITSCNGASVDSNLSPDTIIIDCSIAPGYSGGPVFATGTFRSRKYPILVGLCIGRIKDGSAEGQDQVKPKGKAKSNNAVVVTLDTITS